MFSICIYLDKTFLQNSLVTISCSPLRKLKYPKGTVYKLTFVTINRFCLLSSRLSILNRQYQDGWNTNQKQMKNVHPFCIVFQVLKVLLIKICKIQTPDLLFLVVSY